MALTAPNLDNRTFQSLVDEAKRRISVTCPEWTDHNVSDPGVTLIELFAYMTEIILYRLNQVPERNYIKFLEMIGIELLPGDAARTGVTLPLSPGWPGDPVRVEKGTGIATEPVADEDPVIFSTDREVVLANPRVVAVIRETGSAVDSWDGRSGPFRIWKPARPQAGDALYLGFDRDITGYLLEVELYCQPGAAAGLRPENPQGEWQYFDGTSGNGYWRPLPVAERNGTPVDGTRGLDVELGTVLLQVPWASFDPQPQKRNDVSAWWIRYVYAPKDYEYEAAPVLTRYPAARVLAGTVSASHCKRVQHEILGISDGKPGQTFRISAAPILQLQDGERIEVEAEDGAWEPWFRQDDFATSGRSDRHVTIDTGTGEVRFGPNVLEADGGATQRGAIPATKRKIRITGYRYGGGVEGNLAAGKLTQLRRTISYIVPTPTDPLLQLTNPEPAVGGSNREELATAKLRAQAMLRSLQRAVTPEDYEYHARQAKPNAIARARCITPPFSSKDRRGQPAIRPGMVLLLVVPAVPGDPADGGLHERLTITDSLKNEIASYLEERRLITTRVIVDSPAYLRVSTNVRIRVDPRYSAGDVQASVERALHTYINPVVGGDRNEGWPFEHPLRVSDLRMIVQQVPGVRYVEEIRVFHRRTAEGDRVPLRQEQMELQPDQLVLSEDHNVMISDPDRRGGYGSS